MTPLAQLLLALADDELILAHRNSEWIGHAPILEEDIALANMAQDELGHATIWYDLYANLVDSDPDELVFFRDPADFRNVQFVELPIGDWAFTMLRQYLFDAHEGVLLAQLTASSYRPLATAVAKMRNEELYHYRHSSAWVTRLGLGTAESNQRMQMALEALWPAAQQLFVPLPDEAVLVQEGVIVETAVRHQQWLDIVQPHLLHANLTIPANVPPPATNRADHTPHLAQLLADLQKVARIDPEAEW